MGVHRRYAFGRVAMYFEIIGELTDIETIAVGHGIRDIARLQKRYGGADWRKLKGAAAVRLANRQCAFGGITLV